jgi:hypothetical protein
MPLQGDHVRRLTNGQDSPAPDHPTRRAGHQGESLPEGQADLTDQDLHRGKLRQGGTSEVVTRAIVDRQETVGP